MRIGIDKMFTELHFTRVLLNELRKNGIYKFSKDELEKDLYEYAQNPKYFPMFSDINLRYERADLFESLESLSTFGSIFAVEPNLDTKYIMGNEELDTSKYEQEKVKLMKELVGEYALRNEIIKKQNYKLKIFGLNPKEKYSLIFGNSKKEKIEFNIVTDASIIKEDETCLNEELWCENPENSRELIKLKNAENKHFILDDYTFIINQRKIDDELVSATVYTDILDKEALERVVSYCSLENSNNENIKVLKLRK